MLRVRFQEIDRPLSLVMSIRLAVRPSKAEAMPGIQLTAYRAKLAWAVVPNRPVHEPDGPVCAFRHPISGPLIVRSHVYQTKQRTPACCVSIISVSSLDGFISKPDDSLICAVPTRDGQ